MRSAKSFGKSYVAVYFTNISPGTAESELGFRLILFWETISTDKMATHNSKSTTSIPQRVYFDNIFPCLRALLVNKSTGLRSCGEIPKLFTQISIMAAGTGSTALFTVICSFASRRVPFCANKFFNTGLGFSLVVASKLATRTRVISEEAKATTKFFIFLIGNIFAPM
ncbi:hypothetical protein Bca52824_087946 [Brassica carinata]|uniref:Uncharacterized protein n=1 Tax=Brassica carinata TaxID=52824 RepID=A0A8X7PD99_BRACI|nr:hypothetical protein Bca52824_087946 [Brassica carinata]